MQRFTSCVREQFRQKKKEEKNPQEDKPDARCTVLFKQTVKLVRISQDTKLNADVNQWTGEGSKTPGLQCLPSTGGRLANLMKQGLPGQKQNARVHKMPQQQKRKRGRKKLRKTQKKTARSYEQLLQS